MSNVLVTGATGTVGSEIIRFLYKNETNNKIIAGVRNINQAKNKLSVYPKLNYALFDFENAKTFDGALSGIDILFLLRPPHISAIDTYFKPLISSIKKNNVAKIVFLSVQGAEKSKIIPHNKIEKLIRENELQYIFLRPSYFMQNLTTTLIEDICAKREIILPAGNAKFNWIDIKNIGEAGANLIDEFEDYKNQAYEITGLENKSFGQVTLLINKQIVSPISFRNVNPIIFYRIKKREGMKRGLIIVMILLHFLPRFQREPKISNFYERLTAKKPTTIETFIKREKHLFETD